MYFRHKCCWWQLTICAIYLVIIDVSCVDDDNYRTSPEQQQHHAASDEHNAFQFETVDVNNNSEISSDELSKWYHKLRLNTTNGDVNKLFEKYDLNKNHLIDYGEFVQLINSISDVKNLANAKTIFAKMDSNADGILTYDEAMSSDENKHNVTHLIIETIFSIADVDNDRQITSDEFIRTFDGYSSGSFNRQQKDDPLVDDVISKISTKTLILFDQNSDQKVTLDEIESFLSAQGQLNKMDEISRIFATLDANHDQDLSGDEIEMLPTKIDDVLRNLPIVKPPPAIVA